MKLTWKSRKRSGSQIICFCDDISFPCLFVDRKHHDTDPDPVPEERASVVKERAAVAPVTAATEVLSR